MTITINILNEKVWGLLRNLELLKLIQLPENQPAKKEDSLSTTDWTKFEGAMRKQPLSEVDAQLNELRNGWE